MRAYPALAGNTGFLPAFGHGMASTCWTPYYLHHDGTLSLQKAGAADGPLAYRHAAYAPAVGIALIPGGAGGAGGMQAGDALSFETAALEQDLEIAGAIEAVLWVSSNALHADFRFTLIDVYPPMPDYPHGLALKLSDDLLRRRYPDLQEYPPSQQDDIYRIRAEALPVGNVFKQGHRIRITIAGSRSVRAGMHVHGSTPGGAVRSIAPGTNRLYLDRERASHIVLPLISHRGD
jgi:hypothetical protein